MQNNKLKLQIPVEKRSLLNKKFGKSGIISQSTQIITQVTLEILCMDDEVTFSLDVFPNELPDFLIMKNVYEDSLLNLEIL